MITQRRVGARELNACARGNLDARGRLGPERIALPGGEFAAGDLVVLKRNERRLDVENGNRGQLRAVDTDAGTVSVQLSGDRTVTLPRSYLERETAGGEPALVHGYAVTAHSRRAAPPTARSSSAPMPPTANGATSRGREPGCRPASTSASPTPSTSTTRRSEPTGARSTMSSVRWSAAAVSVLRSTSVSRTPCAATRRLTSSERWASAPPTRRGLRCGTAPCRSWSATGQHMASRTRRAPSGRRRAICSDRSRGAGRAGGWTRRGVSWTTAARHEQPRDVMGAASESGVAVRPSSQRAISVAAMLDANHDDLVCVLAQPVQDSIRAATRSPDPGELTAQRLADAPRFAHQARREEVDDRRGDSLGQAFGQRAAGRRREHEFIGLCRLTVQGAGPRLRPVGHRPGRTPRRLRGCPAALRDR